MFSITCTNVFIALLVFPTWCKSRVIRMEESSRNDEIITWADLNLIQQLFVNGDLDNTTFLQNDATESSGAETTGSHNEEDSNEHMVNPRIISLAQSNHPHNENEENSASQDLCGEGTPCKRERDASMFDRKESVKSQILTSLRMTAPPNISEEDKIPIDSPAIRNMLRQLDDDYLLSSINSETTSKKLISAAKRPYFATNTTNNWFFFNLTSENRNNFQIKSACLKYYIYPNQTNSTITIKLDRYKVRRGIYKPVTHITRTITPEAIQRNESWMTLSYPALDWLVEGWLVNSETNYGIRLSVVEDSNLMATGFRPNELEYKPYLEIEFKPRHRRKRSDDEISFCDAEATVDRCCTFRFEINFENIGWHWVIAPRTYQANYCAGHCSPIQQTSVHNRLVTASQHNMTDLAEWKKPKTCCVPKRYAPISMLYYDHQANIVYSTVPDMKILDCGCA